MASSHESGPWVSFCRTVFGFFALSISEIRTVPIEMILRLAEKAGSYSFICFPGIYSKSIIFGCMQSLFKHLCLSVLKVNLTAVP